MKQDTELDSIIKISTDLLNENGYSVDKNQWFIELHKYNITEDSYKSGNGMMVKNNQGTFGNPGKFVRRRQLVWRQNNMGAHNFDCHTIIYYLRKRPKEKVGGNFYGDMGSTKKIKINDNTILMMSGYI